MTCACGGDEERLYCIQKGDLRTVAQAELGVVIEDVLDAAEEQEFWEDVKKGLEWGLECSRSVAKTAIREALDALGVTIAEERTWTQ